MLDIAANLERVRARIADAIAAAGRTDQVTLIAVSKTYSVDIIDAALRAQQRVFGESTTQEGLDKIARLGTHAPEWHFIGHLQSNKARFIPGNFSWLHSLDSLKLAQRLARLAHERGVRLNALIEVNVTRDPAKHGVTPDELFALLEGLTTENLPALSVRGLMTIGPHGATHAETRAVFAALRELREQANARFRLDGFTELSMGMSDDYVEGILEGSTMVRVGTAIFGDRVY